MRLNKENFNWYGLNHANTSKVLKNDLEYVGSFCVKGEYQPVAVYYCANPNPLKGHKNYVLLCKDAVLLTYIVRGMDKEEMEQWNYQDGLHCKTCDDVIYSINRHDMRYCECRAVFIDGGREYTRYGGDMNNANLVQVDLLNGNVVAFRSEFYE